MNTRPDLSDEEVDALCSGLRQNAAKARYLVQLGLHVERRPNGRPLVMRAHAEQVLAGRTPAANDATATQQPTPPAATGNRAGLVLLFRRKAA